MTEQTGKTFLVLSSLLITVFLAAWVALLRSHGISLEYIGGLTFLEMVIPLFVLVAFPLSAWLLRYAKKPIWMKFALAFNGLFFALELVTCVLALSAWRSGMMTD